MIENDVVFTDRPSSIPFGYGLTYKIAMICICISKNCEPRKSCSLVKLQLIITTLLSKGNLNNLISLTKDKSFCYTPVRFDPSINKAVTFALKDGLIRKLVNGNYRLTQIGKKLVNRIIKSQILTQELKEFDNLGILDDVTLDFIINTWRYDD